MQTLPLDKFEGKWKGKCVLDIKLSADVRHIYKPHTIDLGNCKSCSISTDNPIIITKVCGPDETFISYSDKET